MEEVQVSLLDPYQPESLHGSSLVFIVKGACTASSGLGSVQVLIGFKTVYGIRWYGNPYCKLSEYRDIIAKNFNMNVYIPFLFIITFCALFNVALFSSSFLYLSIKHFAGDGRE